METPTPALAGSSAAVDPAVVDALNDLLQLDHDAIGAYEIAIDKLQDRALADRVEEFRHDHQRHIAELNEVLTAAGATPRNEPHATGPFKQALQSLGGLAGDKGLLMAWRTNELQARSKYSAAASRFAEKRWPVDARRVVERNALDEERHYRWVVDALERMGVGSGNAPAASSGGGTMDAVRERAGSAAEGARGRVAEGLAAAGERLGVAGDRGGRAGAVAERIGDGLQKAARGVREGEVSELGAELEARVRRSPAKTLLAAAAAGFVIGRVLRS